MSISALLQPVYRPWRTAFRYMRTMAHEQPVFFYSIILGTLGPVSLLIVPPIRYKLGYRSPEAIPMSYPVPNRPRRKVEGYDDP